MKLFKELIKCYQFRAIYNLQFMKWLCNFIASLTFYVISDISNIFSKFLHTKLLQTFCCQLVISIISTISAYLMKHDDFHIFVFVCQIHILYTTLPCLCGAICLAKICCRITFFCRTFCRKNWNCATVNAEKLTQLLANFPNRQIVSIDKIDKFVEHDWELFGYFKVF